MEVEERGERGEGRGERGREGKGRERKERRGEERRRGDEERKGQGERIKMLYLCSSVGCNNSNRWFSFKYCAGLKGRFHTQNICV